MLLFSEIKLNIIIQLTGEMGVNHGKFKGRNSWTFVFGILIVKTACLTDAQVWHQICAALENEL